MVIGTSSLRSAVVSLGGSLLEAKLAIMWILISFEDMLMFSCSLSRVY